MNDIIRVINRQKSLDGSTKYVMAGSQNNTFESVYLNLEKYESVCISSQGGCAMGCVFCATGLDGFQRNLSDIEIREQVVAVLREQGSLGENVKVSFMGMGEPLLNLDNVIMAYRYLSSVFPRMRFSLSTVGITPKIIELSEYNTNIELQISLHAPNDDLRRTLMPICEKYGIRNLLNAAAFYNKKTGNSVRLNYMLLKGVNDSDQEVAELYSLLKGFPAKIKISSYSHIDNLNFKSCTREEHLSFTQKLSRLGLNVYNFFSSGTDIDGGCGQLRTRTSN
jgi:23S rRNA (adenine2503-C2)-methyltransferase